MHYLYIGQLAHKWKRKIVAADLANPIIRAGQGLIRPAWLPYCENMFGFWYKDLTRAQDGFKVALVELRDADIYYVYSLADFSYYCGYSLVAAGLGIDRNLVLDYGRTSAWRLNFKNQTYPCNPGVNPDLIRPKTKKFPLDPQFKPTVHCSLQGVLEKCVHWSTASN